MSDLEFYCTPLSILFVLLAEIALCWLLSIHCLSLDLKPILNDLLLKLRASFNQTKRSVLILYQPAKKNWCFPPQISKLNLETQAIATWKSKLLLDFRYTSSNGNSKNASFVVSQLHEYQCCFLALKKNTFFRISSEPQIGTITTFFLGGGLPLDLKVSWRFTLQAYVVVN